MWQPFFLKKWKQIYDKVVQFPHGAGSAAT